MPEPILWGIATAVIAEVVGGIIIVLLTGRRQEVQTLVSRLTLLGISAIVIGFLVSSFLSNISDPGASKSRSARVVYSSSEAFHLGDQDFSSWSPRFGLCLDVDFNVHLPIQTLTLELETYGAEAHNLIYLNGREVAVIKPQGVKQPNQWTEAQSIPIPTDKLAEGLNMLTICSGLVEVEPDFPGDKDDFQFRNIRLIAD